MADGSDEIIVTPSNDGIVTDVVSVETKIIDGVIRVNTLTGEEPISRPVKIKAVYTTYKDGRKDCTLHAPILSTIADMRNKERRNG